MMAGGASAYSAAKALGLRAATLALWLRQHPEPLMRPVEVTHERLVAPGLVLTTPSGFRVEGLDVRSLAELLEVLS